EGLGPLRALAEHAADPPPAAAGENPLGQPRQLEEQDVPGAQALTQAARLEPCTEVRDVHADEPRERPDLPRREAPADDATPVLAHGCRLTPARRIDQPGDVVHQRLDRIVRDLERAIALAIAAEIGRPDAMAELREQRHLVAPRVPALGEAVQAEG